MTEKSRQADGGAISAATALVANAVCCCLQAGSVQHHFTEDGRSLKLECATFYSGHICKLLCRLAACANKWLRRCLCCVWGRFVDCANSLREVTWFVYFSCNNNSRCIKSSNKDFLAGISRSLQTFIGRLACKKWAYENRNLEAGGYETVVKKIKRN
jgi:hypothetical protein